MCIDAGRRESAHGRRLRRDARRVGVATLAADTPRRQLFQHDVHERYFDRSRTRRSGLARILKRRNEEATVADPDRPQ